MYRHFAQLLIEHLKKLTAALTDEIEDIARLCAQALVGEGDIYFYAEGEMKGVYLQALHGKEPFQPVERIKELKSEELSRLTSADRVLLIGRSAEDEQILSIARYLYDEHIPFAAIASATKKDTPLDDLADIFIDMSLADGLIPKGFAPISGHPDLLVALFLFHQIQFQLEDMFSDMNENK